MFKTIIFCLLLLSINQMTFAQDGSLDNTFDGDGKVFYGNNLSAKDLAIHSSGKITVVDATNNTLNLVRFAQDGSLDSSFDSDGFFSIYFDPTIFGYYICNKFKLKIQNDDKILLAGYVRNSFNDSLVIIRLNNDGSFDTTFNYDGIATLDLNDYDFPNSAFCDPISFEIQNDGKIVVFDRIRNNLSSNEGFIIIRFNNDGTLDSGFNNYGYIINNAYFNMSYYGQGLCLQNDGKIVVNGSDYYTTTLLRYNQDGSIDSTFNQNGEVSITIPNSIGVYASINIDNNGNFVVAGSFDDNDSIFVVRLNSNGDLDSTFDYDGINFFGYSGYDFLWDYRSIAIQNDNKILVSGIAENYTSSDDIYIFRINTNGNLDSSFDNDGVVITSSNSCDLDVNSMALQNDGKIIIGGDACNSIFLARYNSSNSTSVDLVKNESIRFYPNPFSDEIKFEVVDNSEIKVFVHDILGRKYLEQSLSNIKSINTSQLPAGTYLLSIRHQNGYIQNEKIIKP